MTNIDAVLVDYLALIPQTRSRESSYRHYAGHSNHVWYDEYHHFHISYCREHMSELLRRYEARERASKLHRAYRAKRKGRW